MPPRIPYSPAARPLAQPLRQDVCTSCLRQAFSTSSTHALPTKLRREMFGWINGPGENLRYPKPNSTNYLTDYNRAGRPVARTPRNDAGSSGPDTVDSKALEDAAGESTQTIKDHRDKLKPFPLNEHFISEPVLSEELRQEIWRRVQVEGKSVRHVSVELGVEMRRVGAVVRLVEVERRMKAEVSRNALSTTICNGNFDMMKTPNRLVLQTSTMVIHKTNYNSLTANSINIIATPRSTILNTTG